jgi:ribosomal protein S19
MILKLTSEEIRELLENPAPEFPKYTTQLINLANQNSQATRPNVVGQLSELIQEFSGRTIEEWQEWYLNKYPDAISKATEKVSNMIELLRDAMDHVDEEMIEMWIRDLVIVKTFIGLKFQEAVLKKIAEIKKTNFKLAEPDEESEGIDGYIGERAVSIKPISYKAKKALLEEINADFIFYDKRKNGITIEFDF